MASLRLDNPKAIDMDYDGEADVLYLSFGPPREALGVDLGEGVIARYIEDTGEIVGFTFVGLKRIMSTGDKPLSKT
jgi:uncharacterized protein YuzE